MAENQLLHLIAVVTAVIVMWIRTGLEYNVVFVGQAVVDLDAKLQRQREEIVRRIREPLLWPWLGLRARNFWRNGMGCDDGGRWLARGDAVLASGLWRHACGAQASAV